MVGNHRSQIAMIIQHNDRSLSEAEMPVILLFSQTVFNNKHNFSRLIKVTLKQMRQIFDSVLVG